MSHTIKILNKIERKEFTEKYKNKLISFNFIFVEKKSIAIVLDVTYDYNFGYTFVLFSENKKFNAPILHIDFEVLK